MKVMISAGIEKFYTYAQFFSVLGLSAGLIVIVVLIVYLGVRAPSQRKVHPIGALAASFATLLLGELMLSVAPTGAAVLAGTALECAGIMLSGPFFYLFARQVSLQEEKRKAAYAALLVQAAALGLLGLWHPAGAVFFQEFGFDRVRPGALYYLLISLSGSWGATGIAICATEALRRRGRKRRALALVALGAALLLVAFVLHQAVPGNRIFLIFPGAVLPGLALFGAALLPYDLLDLPLIPLQRIIARTEALIVVLGEDGAVLSMTRSRYRNLDIQGVTDAPALFARLAARIPEPDQRERFRADATSPAGGEGRLAFRTEAGTLYAEYSIDPVLYLRRKVGWVWTIRDTTKEELGIRKLAKKEEALRRGYAKLRRYERTTLRREAEEWKENLLRGIDGELRTELGYVAEEVARLLERPDSRPSLEPCLAAARESLARIRNATALLKSEDRRVVP